MGDVYRNLAEQLTVKERVHISDKDERISEILWKRAVYGSAKAKIPTNRSSGNGAGSPSNRNSSSNNSSSNAGGGNNDGKDGGSAPTPAEKQVTINTDLMDRGAFKVALELMLGEEYVADLRGERAQMKWMKAGVGKVGTIGGRKQLFGLAQKLDEEDRLAADEAKRKAEEAENGGPVEEKKEEPVIIPKKEDKKGKKGGKDSNKDGKDSNAANEELIPAKKVETFADQLERRIKAGEKDATTVDDRLGGLMSMGAALAKGKNAPKAKTQGAQIKMEENKPLDQLSQLARTCFDSTSSDGNFLTMNEFKSIYFMVMRQMSKGK